VSPASFHSRREKDLFDNFADLEYLESRFHEYLGRYKYSRSHRLLILKALDFARLAHNGQERDEGIPYITHPVRVANILLHEVAQMESDLVCTALLHDVIEDCAITTRELKNNFNDHVAHMVKVLSKDPRVENHKRVYYEGILHATDDIKLVKICDRLDNLRSLRFSTNKTRVKRYVSETERKYTALAEHLNPYVFREFKHEILFLRNRRS
jgi:GTP pyrophosphokinase